MDFFWLMFSPFWHPGILAGGTLIFFVLGWLWYNPITPIGKIWIRYFPMPEKDKMPKWSQIAVMILFQIFMGFVVTHTVMVIWNLLGDIMIDYPNFWTDGGIWRPTSILSDIGGIGKTLIMVKIYLWFVLIKDLGHWYFEKRPFPLVLIGVGYYLVGILGVCGLLAMFA